MSFEHVLIVDDEEHIRRIAELSARNVGGWRVSQADNGSQGIELAAQQQPDLILLDVMMPGMDGPDTLARLKANEATRAIPVIFLTAKVQTREIERYLALGAIGVIAKPFDPMTFPDEVRRLYAEKAQPAA